MCAHLPKDNNLCNFEGVPALYANHTLNTELKKEAEYKTNAPNS